MKLYLIENYKLINPELKGKAHTDSLILECIGKENARVKRKQGGKPYIEGGPFFSVSHSENLMAVIVSDVNVGIDIQHTKNTDELRLAERFFSEEETDLVRKGAAEFYILWTRKEAFCKYTGRGLSQIIRGEEVLGRQDVVFHDIKLGDNCFCAVCTDVREDIKYEISVFNRK